MKGGAHVNGRAARLLSALVGACAFYALMVTPALAAPAWVLPAPDLSAAGQNASSPQVAIDPAGDAVAVWTRFNGTNTIIQSASRPAGGAWSAPLDLSAAGQNASSPQIAVDPAGNAVAVWTRSNGTNNIIQTASKPAGG